MRWRSLPPESQEIAIFTLDNIIIHSAVYANLNVTDQVQRMTDNGIRLIEARMETFVDMRENGKRDGELNVKPTIQQVHERLRNRVKVLSITYQYGECSKILNECCTDGQMIFLTPMKIYHANYAGINVTKNVQKLVK